MQRRRASLKPRQHQLRAEVAPLPPAAAIALQALRAGGSEAAPADVATIMLLLSRPGRPSAAPTEIVRASERAPQRLLLKPMPLPMQSLPLPMVPPRKVYHPVSLRCLLHRVQQVPAPAAPAPAAESDVDIAESLEGYLSVSRGSRRSPTSGRFGGQRSREDRGRGSASGAWDSLQRGRD